MTVTEGRPGEPGPPPNEPGGHGGPAAAPHLQRPNGFTLIEVIIAFAILSIAVVASIQGFAQGLRLLKLSGDHQRAILYADQKLREVVTPTEGREGEEDRETGFTWERVTTPVEAPELVERDRESPWRVWNISVRVRWDQRREIELATMRTMLVTKDGTGDDEPGLPSTGTATGTGPSGNRLGRPPGSDTGRSGLGRSTPGRSTSPMSPPQRSPATRGSTSRFQTTVDD